MCDYKECVHCSFIYNKKIKKYFTVVFFQVKTTFLYLIFLVITVLMCETMSDWHTTYNNYFIGWKPNSKYDRYKKIFVFLVF